MQVAFSSDFHLLTNMAARAQMKVAAVMLDWLGFCKPREQRTEVSSVLHSQNRRMARGIRLTLGWNIDSQVVMSLTRASSALLPARYFLTGVGVPPSRPEAVDSTLLMAEGPPVAGVAVPE